MNILLEDFNYKVSLEDTFKWTGETNVYTNLVMIIGRD